MIDHIGILASDLDASKDFYAQALAALGYEVLMDFEHDGKRHVGLGLPGKPELWLSQGAKATLPVHIALRAESRAQVDAFHHAALAAGGRDNGAPGLRPHYHAHYYGAFVLDRDGNNLEAVCHAPE